MAKTPQKNLNAIPHSTFSLCFSVLCFSSVHTNTTECFYECLFSQHTQSHSIRKHGWSAINCCMNI